MKIYEITYIYAFITLFYFEGFSAFHTKKQQILHVMHCCVVISLKLIYYLLFFLSYHLFIYFLRTGSHD